MPPATTAPPPLPVAPPEADPVRSSWPRMTYEEYLVDPSVPQCSEWVDGEVVPTMSVIDPHADLVSLLNAVLRLLAEDHDLGVVRGEPFNMKTGPNLPGRSPDVLFLASAHRHRLQRNHLRGPADLVIEVVSEDSRRRDRVTKLAEYEAGGVPEYWWLDQDREEAGFFHRGNDEKYQRVHPDEDGFYQSQVLPQLRLEVASLWREPLPKVRDVLRGWEEE